MAILRWLGDHLFAAVLAFFVAFLLGVLIGNPGNVLQKSTGSRTPHGWPDGRSAWTAILASEATRGLAEVALERARRVPSRGVALGVLHSNDYSSLRPGYWVAFAGQFNDAAAAQATADRYRSEFPSSYPRFVER